MLGNFTYCNPTKLYFGEDSLINLNEELPKYGKNVVLVYGGGSIKKNGIYDKVTRILKNCGKDVAEISGVMPNPTLAKLYEGTDIARKHKADLILAVGGGSVCDYSKAVAVSVNCSDDPWEKYFIRFEEPDCKIIPVGCVLTMVGTGSEMNGGSVITNHKQKLKIGHVFGDNVFPKFSILNPKFTFTLPKYQMVAGFYDIMSHILEQYFSGDDDNTTDYIIEAVMTSLIKSSRKAVKNPEDYEARSNIMWCATLGLNTVTGLSKTQDWEVHNIEHQLGAYTDCPHGLGLAVISMPYYRYIYKDGIDKFVRFAENVWNVNTEGKTNEEIALEGITCLENFAKELGIPLTLRELGATEDMLPKIAETSYEGGGYKYMTHEDILNVLKECF